jgi:hypothetical protein
MRSKRWPVRCAGTDYGFNCSAVTVARLTGEWLICSTNQVNATVCIHVPLPALYDLTASAEHGEHFTRTVALTEMPLP